MRTLLAALGLLACAGCAGLSYVQPTSGDRARVRFVTETSTLAVMKGYDGPDCSGEEREWMRLRVGPLITSTVTRLGMPLWEFHDNAAKEVYVATNKDLVALIWTEQGTLKCGVPVTYRFMPGQDYEVKYTSSGRSCSVSISMIAARGDGHERRRVGTFDSTTSAYPGCYRQFARTRAW